MFAVRIRRKPDRKNLELYYRDPLTGAERTRSAGTNDRGEAERAAERWEQKLQNSGSTDISWDVFRERFESEHLPRLSKSTRQTACGALNSFERLLGHPRRLRDVTTSVLSQFASKLRTEKKPETTVYGILNHLRVAIRWAVAVELLPRPPHFPMPRLGKRKLMRGRAITTEEFERLLLSVVKVRPTDDDQWKDLLNGLWLSGLRIDEARRLTWHPSPFCVDFTGTHPRFRIHAEGQKSRKDELLPMAPDFAAWLEPRQQDEGFVFHLPNTTTGERFSAKRIIKVISAIGKQAGIVANTETKKHATAHDLRRSFGVRWAMKVKPLTLQKMMRHEQISTTMKFYVELEMDDLERDIWCTGKCTEPENRPKKQAKKTSGK